MAVFGVMEWDGLLYTCDGAYSVWDLFFLFLFLVYCYSKGMLYLWLPFDDRNYLESSKVEAFSTNSVLFS